MTTNIGQDAGWQISKVSASADDILAGISVGTSTTDQNGVYAYQLSSYYSNTHYQDDHFRHADGHSKIIGFTFDGYPFYGPYGYDLSMSMESTVVMMTSSYALRSEEQYSVYENGTVVTDVGYNQPAVSNTTYYRIPYTSTTGTLTSDGIYFDASDNVIAVYNGGFIQDYKYNPGTGHLDESNGRYCKTPDYPNGTYAYFLTSTYPCTVGNRPRNNLDTDNTSVKQVKTTRNNRDLSLNTFNSDTNIPITDDVINNIAISSITMAFDASYGVGYTHFWMSTDSSGNAVMNIKTDGDPYPIIAGVTSYTNEVTRDGFGGGNEISTGEWKNSTMNYYGGLSEANSPKTTATLTNDIYFPFSSVGVFVNGTAIYTRNAGSTVPPYGGSGADVNAPTGFYFDPAAFGDRYGIDEGAGHPTPGGEYHNHDIEFLYTKTVVGLPDAPTDVVAVSGNASAKVYFSTPYDGGSTITSYRVDGNGTYYGSGTSSPITLTGLTNGNNYSFYVRAINENGTSDNSTTVSVDVGTPTEPTSVNATPGNGTITVTFTAPDSSGGAIITRYFVYNSSGNIDASGTSSPIIVRGLTNGTTYTYYVAAKNIYGTGSKSSAVSATAGTPSSPRSVVATAGNAYVDMSFSAPTSNGGSTILYYIITDIDGNIDSSGTTSPIRVNGLTNGTSYTFYVNAVNVYGTGSASTGVTATPYSSISTPSDPQNVSAVAGNTYVEIIFSAPVSDGGSTITNYIITDSDDTVVASGTYSPIRIDGLTNGTSYTFYVKAVNAAGIGTSSAPISATPYSNTTVPDAPTDVVASTGNTYIDITFSGPANDGGSPILYYIITDSDDNSVASGTNSPIRVDGLTNGTSYTFYVKAVNDVGFGSSSSGVTVTPYTIPSEPQNVSATAGNTYADILFSAPETDGGSSILSYIITDPNDITTASGSSLSIRVSGLTNGITYTFYVKAVNAAGIGSPSAPVSVIPYTVPSEPLNVRALAGNAYIDMSFSEPASAGGSPIQYYIISDLSGTITATGSNSPIKISGLTNGRTYTYKVAAVNSSGTGSYSTDVSAIPYTIPGDLQNVLSTIGNSSVSIAFTINDTGGSPILYYALSTDSAGNNVYTSTTSSPLILNGLTNGTTYIYYLCAVNIAGRGTRTLIVFTPAEIPGPPTVSANAGNKYIDINYSPPANTGGSAITSYTLYDISNNTTKTGITSSPITITGLINGATYTYKLAAVNTIGTGTYSSDVSAVPYTIPNAPYNISANYGNKSATISFSQPSNNGSVITQYLVADNNDVVYASGPSSPITVSNLTNGTTYYFKVAAQNRAGIGSYSGSVSVVPKTVPDAPASVSAAPGNAYIDVTFSIPESNGADIIRYNISYNNNIEISYGSPVRLTNLTNGSTYSIKVAAVNSVGTGAYSSTIYSIPRTVPDSPSITNVTSGNTTLIVEFSAPSFNGGSEITSYIAYANYNGNVTTTIGSSSPITIYNLENGSTYAVSVSAVNIAGTGTASTSYYAFPYTVPDAPTIKSSTPGDSSVVISFYAPSSNGGSSITGYSIVDNDDNTYVSGTSSPLTVSGLTNGTEYTFYVKASNAAGSGSASDATTALPYALPYAPTNITTTVGDSYVDVSFSAPTYTGGHPITYYNISDNNSIDVSGTSSPILISNLTNGTEYTFYIKAYNQYGPGNAASFTVTPYTVPDAPVIKSSISENATGRIYFTIPNNNGSEITAYQIIDASNTQYTTNNTTKSPVIIYNLTNGNTYTFYLVAVNAAGTSANSTSFMIHPYTTPSAPTITNTGSGNTYVDISFSEPSSDGGLAITQYNVISSPGNKLTTGTSSPIRVSSLQNGTTYTFKIAAKNSAGIGTYSSNVAGIPYTTPDAPSISKIDAWNSSVNIFFTAPVNNGGLSITSYSVYDTSNNITITGFTSSPITLPGLINNTTYHFFMKAVSDAGSGESSSIVTATPRAVPYEPMIIGASAGSNGGSVSIFFNEPLNNGGFPITNYIALSNPDGITSSSVSSPITVQNLQKGIPYTFTIQAQNEMGTGPPSLPSIPVLPIGIPDVPTITQLDPGDRFVRISALPPINTGGLPIIRYFAISNPDNIEAYSNTSPISVAGLRNGTSYTFKIKAINAFGSSPYTQQSGSMIPFTIPDPPTGIAIDNGNRRAEVYYTNPLNNGGAPITGYLLRDSANNVISSGANSPLIIDHLANGQLLVNGQSYTFLLSVVNAAGPSPPTVLTVIPMTSPNAPNITNVMKGFGYADVVFNPPTNNGGSEVLYYTLYLDELEIIGYSSPIRIPDLLNGSQYMIRLSATNAAGSGPSTAFYTFNMPPSTPSPPTITGLDAGNGYVDITLEPPVNTGGYPITGYSFTPMPSADYNVTQYTSTFRYSGLTNGVSYTFTIRAINREGSSEAVVSDSVIPYTVPDAPTITDIVASDESVVIYFDPPGFNGGSDILDYTLYYTDSDSDSSGSFVITSSASTISGLTNDLAYIFTMVARNASGFSESSVEFGPITPKSEKIEYCIKQSCVNAQYSKLTTGGNDPKITKAMRLSQVLNSRKPCNGFL